LYKGALVLITVYSVYFLIAKSNIFFKWKINDTSTTEHMRTFSNLLFFLRFWSVL